MIESLLIVAGGLLGSGHCIGMCGGFVLMLGAHGANRWQILLRQCVYASGRVTVYSFAGALVGFGAWKLGSAGLGIAYVQAVLSLLAGLFLIAEGAFSTGLIARPFTPKAGCPGVGVFASLLRAPNLSSVFVAGLLNGLLPCGLVYGYLALAASAGNIFAGAGVMALFGLGTIPALILTGMSGSLLNQVWRQRCFRVAALCMIMTGLLALWQGVNTIAGSLDEEVSCPFCVTAAS